MPPKNYRNSDMTFLLLVSFLGLLIIAILTVFPPVVTGNLPWRKPLIGAIFSSICIFGVLAVFSPIQCSKILKLRKKENHSNSSSGKSISHGSSSTLQGHHPSCGKFVAHVFQIRSKTFCAACVGLLLGGLLALAAALLYFFGKWYVVEQSSSLIVLVGILGVGLGLFQFKFRNLLRLSLNTFFVLGTLLILIGIDEFVQSLMVDLFVVCLILFWLFTRISLSQWDHKRICSDCNVAGCEFAD
ncbi:MAG: hypothetical protein JSW14_07175 [Candidatus Bathyarchaeum sp.]|nr:MAG: hypothetical protein JSW14_07175 [Candidatus Bathyarchaeum sp.]